MSRIGIPFRRRRQFCSTEIAACKRGAARGSCFDPRQESRLLSRSSLSRARSRRPRFDTCPTRAVGTSSGGAARDPPAPTLNGGESPPPPRRMMTEGGSSSLRRIRAASLAPALRPGLPRANWRWAAHLSPSPSESFYSAFSRRSTSPLRERERERDRDRERERSSAPMAPPPAVVKRHCPQFSLLVSLLVFLCASCNVSAAVQHKVGDLDAWGVPPSSKPEVYSIWSQSRNFEIGDSLMFLYPPSQDAVLQVTEVAFESCDIGNPILRISDGNSLFNITSPGELFFTSSVPGRCEKKQKLRISVLGGNGGSSSPAAGSLPVVFAPAQSPSFAPPAATGIATAAATLLVVLLFQFLQP